MKEKILCVLACGILSSSFAFGETKTLSFDILTSDEWGLNRRLAKDVKQVTAVYVGCTDSKLKYESPIVGKDTTSVNQGDGEYSYHNFDIPFTVHTGGFLGAFTTCYQLKKINFSIEAIEYIGSKDAYRFARTKHRVALAVAEDSKSKESVHRIRIVCDEITLEASQVSVINPMLDQGYSQKLAGEFLVCEGTYPLGSLNRTSIVKKGLQLGKWEPFTSYEADKLYQYATLEITGDW